VKKLLILSGKGGTGKTTIAGAFVYLSQANAVADCDVDAPNLHLILHDDVKPVREDFVGMNTFFVEEARCVRCDACRVACRFGAVSLDLDGRYSIRTDSCEGCAVCAFVCPAEAILEKEHIAGDLLLSVSNQRVFSTAKLRMGSGASGRLVTEVKKRLFANAKKEATLAIIDGSPGIGCPVIASISGVDLVLIVAEPSVTGISDMERVVKTAKGFGTRVAVCVNRFDTNLAKTQEIESYCKSEGLAFVGRIPFDPEVVSAVNRGLTIVEAECAAAAAVRRVYDETMRLVDRGERAG
jgi:MinD superfamily P-loop ATPase